VYISSQAYLSARSQKRLIAIVGPTATGKSNLALSIAHEFGAEVVNADSRQVYRYMDIGTDKPSLMSRAQVPHHLIDIVDPDENFNLAKYKNLATKTIDVIIKRGKLPLLVGGSGLYVWSVLEGWNIPEVAPNYPLRHALESRAANEGIQSLYKELQGIDPLAAGRINPANVRRLVRALEIYEMTGHIPSQLQRKTAPDLFTYIIGLNMERGDLYRRIDERIDIMMQKGLIDETKKLFERGYNSRLSSMSGIGYKQIGEFLEGHIDLPSAIAKIKRDTRRLARHQCAWFRLGDDRIHWIVEGNAEDEAKTMIRNFVL